MAFLFLAQNLKVAGHRISSSDFKLESQIERPNVINPLYVELTDENFQKEVLESNQPILVTIAATWCGSCHIMASIIEQLTADYEGKLRIGWLDIDTNKQVTREYSMQERPILLFYKDGKIKDHIVGIVPKQKIENKLKNSFGLQLQGRD